MFRALFAPMPRRRRSQPDAAQALEHRVLLSGANGQWLKVFTCPVDATADTEDGTLPLTSAGEEQNSAVPIVLGNGRIRLEVQPRV